MVHLRPVTVYVRAPNGTLCQAGDVEIASLKRASVAARDLMKQSGSQTKVILDGATVDFRSVVAILAWIDDIDFAKDLRDYGLEVRYAGPNPTLIEIVKLHGTGYNMRIPSTLRGQHLETAIWEYGDQHALTLNEFKAIHELIPWSAQTRSAKSSVLFKKVHGPVPPELDAIEEYAREEGMRKDMEQFEHNIRRAKEHQEKEAAAAAAREAEKAAYRAEKAARKAREADEEE